MQKESYEGYAISKINGEPVGIIISDEKSGCYLVQELKSGIRYQLFKHFISDIKENKE